MKVDKDNIGDSFQQMTKYSRDQMPKGTLDWDARPEKHKSYENPIRWIDLPEPKHSGGKGLWDILEHRRTKRTYKQDPLTLELLGQTLWAANGKTREMREAILRTAPSAGALYPIEIYIMANRVEGLQRGMYHYDISKHKLAFIKEGDFSDDAALGSLGQAMLAKSGAVIFLSAVIQRCRWKYGQRAYRYIYLDAGHVAQNVCLAGDALSLGVCPIGAFYDDELNDILDLDGKEETVLYALTVGK
jgi:SagB-type dehydrogenase family enzyme